MCQTTPFTTPHNKKDQPALSRPTSSDPWDDWQPQWQHNQERSSPHRVQEQHSPTVPVTVRISATREDYACQRRLLDARLWDSLPREAQDAAIEIAFSYEALTKGLGATTSNWARIPGARNPSAVANAYGRLSGAYMDWAHACAKEKLSHSMIIDILCVGISCSALDQDRRVRKGTSRQNLYDGLMLYAQLRGWIPKSR